MKKAILALIMAAQLLTASKILIPMDLSQKDHLKAYGIAYWVLTQDVNVEWLLNYRGGSFMIDNYPNIVQECRIRGVSLEIVTDGDAVNIYGEIDVNNMEVILLEKAPKIAIYTPTNKQPWDDAVTLALSYASASFCTELLSMITHISPSISAIEASSLYSAHTSDMYEVWSRPPK